MVGENISKMSARDDNSSALVFKWKKAAEWAADDDNVDIDHQEHQQPSHNGR